MSREHFPKIENEIRARMESKDVDSLLNQFPTDLQERLILEIEEMDDDSAVEYLINRLVSRKLVLAQHNTLVFPEGVAVSHEEPLAIANRIRHEVGGDEMLQLGQGINGEVVTSLRYPNSCYKVLYADRANLLGSTAKREAVALYEVGELLTGHGGAVRVPNFIKYVDTEQFRALHMERIDGYSIKRYLEDNIPLPEDFDIARFEEKLVSAVEFMNEAGWYHRDLTNNPGNVMIDKEGNPWIIDFGNAVKRRGPDDTPNTYQVTFGGASYIGGDVSGVRGLCKRLRKHILQNKEGGL